MNFLTRLCLVNFTIGSVLLVLFGVEGVNLLFSIGILSVVTLSFLIPFLKYFNNKKIIEDTEKTRTLKKLSRGMWLWQAETTVLFILFFILALQHKSISTMNHYLMYWGTYGFFTMYHIVFYIVWKAIISGAIDEAERREIAKLNKPIKEPIGISISKKIPIEQYQLRRIYGRI